MTGPGPHTILYDGDCGLCARSVLFVLPRDTRGVFRFSPLQGAHAIRTLEKHGKTPDLSSFRLVRNEGTPNETIVEQSTAGLYVLQGLGGIYAVLGVVGFIVPKFLRDAVYNFIARNRIAMFGRADACLLATPEQRLRFVDDG